MKMKESDLRLARPIIRLAIEEDLGKGDITSQLLHKANEVGTANIISREEIVVCGMDVVREVLSQFDKRLKLKVFVRDGEHADVGKKIATIKGPICSMLSAERVMLNFLQRLCGIATTTRQFVRAVEGTKARIYDTRKTTAGWRILEKYAVRCGGGYNHRLGLYDAILIKDNHLAELGPDFQQKLTEVVRRARKIRKIKFVAVEVDHVDDQLNYVLKIPGIDIVLLDNMGQWQLKHAVEMRDAMCGENRKPLLEASGNITLGTVSAIAQCGVDRIAVGAITHSARAVDIGLDR
jgi:nicotinate-nucleotide pyrophosphorylase (carboxylating)